MKEKTGITKNMNKTQKGASGQSPLAPGAGTNELRSRSQNLGRVVVLQRHVDDQAAGGIHDRLLNAA